MNRHKPFAVHGTHIADSKSKLLSRHADEDAANAEAARLQRLMVHFWDGDRPVYRDVTVEGPPVEDVWQNLVNLPKFMPFLLPPTNWRKFYGGNPPGPSQDDPPVPADPDGDDSTFARDDDGVAILKPITATEARERQDRYWVEKLNNFDRGNFGHDIAGIYNHLNRETGGLENCFVPRCALPAAA